VKNNASDQDMLLAAIAAVDEKVDKLADSVRGVVTAFEAVSGAVKTIEMAGKIAKPLLWLAGIAAAIGTAWAHLHEWITAHIFHR
jgi:hypothetical protein